MIALMGLVAALAALPTDDAPLTTSYRKSTNVRDGEMARIRAHAGMVRRSGNTLTITYQGKTVFSDSDKVCEDDTEVNNIADCYQNFFLGPIRLKSPRTGRMETYAQIERYYYEGNGYFIVDDDGELVPVSGTALGSPDGLSLASGQDFVDEMNDDVRLMILDWRTRTAVQFKPSCLPIRWNGNSEFTALCQMFDSPGITRFEGTARKDARGQWTLSIGRLLSWDGGEGDAPPSAGQIYPAQPAAPQ